jgi:hypothetical protein|uniref:DUF4412 domain-containing protein n=2 Tax=Cephaloticoccus sp. TaxID=1985742 RepID=UPI0040492C8D
MKQILKLALLASVLFCPGLLTAKTFEGTVRMQISNGSKSTHNLSYSIKRAQVRTDIQLGDDKSASAIMDLTKDEMIILMPGQPIYMTMSIKTTVDKVTGGKTGDVNLENTGITTEILGYTCTKYLAKTKEGSMEIWATTELGTFMGLGNMMGDKKAKLGWESALVGKDFFPLRVKSATGSENPFSLEATAVEPKSLPDSLFAPPANYRKFDLGGMMQGMGGANPFGR